MAACGYVSEYEKGVYNYEPVYCYRSIGKVQCYDTPNQRDEKRLVNYYGPAPSRYAQPVEPEMTEMAPPPPINYFVVDKEPIPQPDPPKAGTLPWLERKPVASLKESASSSREPATPSKEKVAVVPEAPDPSTD